MSDLIKEWPDEMAVQMYPLSGNIADNGLLIDASFYQFNFIPTLQRYQVTADGIDLTLILDDGELIVTVEEAGLVRVERDGRLHGKLIIGDITELKSKLGRNILCRTKFDASTVINIQPKNGLYSIEGLHGDVIISGDFNQRFEVDGDTVKWSAIGIPTRTVTLSLKQFTDKVYAVTDTNQLIRISLEDAAVELIAENMALDSMTVKSDGSVYGTDTTNAYRGNNIPVKLLYNGQHGQLSGSAVFNDKLLLVGAFIVQYDIDDDSINTPLTAPACINSICLKHGTTDQFYLVGCGVFDADEEEFLNDRIYLYDATAETVVQLGEIDVDFNHRINNFHGLIDTADGLFGVVVDIDGDAGDGDSTSVKYRVVKIDSLVFTGEVIASSEYSATVGRPLSLSFGYNAVINSSSFTPLKLINAVEPVNNGIVLEDTELIRFNPQNGQLFVELTREPQITRKKNYA